MSLPGSLRESLIEISTTLPWAWLLVKLTLLLAAAWLAHFALARANPRWRTLLWRGVAVGAALVAAWSFGLPGVEIRVAPPEPIAAAIPIPTEVAQREPVILPPDRVEPVAAPAVVEPVATAPQAAVQDDAVAPAAARPVESSASVPSWPTTLLIAWVAGVVLLAARLGFACLRIASALRLSRAVPEEIAAQAGRIAAALGRRPVRLRSSAEFSVPFLWGLWRPVLVLPERMCEPDYRGQLPGILAHELAHVRSRDCVWTAAIQAVSILLWFHPLAWRIGSAHRGACDAVCDAVSAAHLGNVEDYCRTLARVALECSGKCPATGLAMARTCDVRRRIAALRQRVFATALSRRAVAAVSLAGFVSLALFAGVRVALAELSQEDEENQKTTTPISWSAEEFGRLPAAEQREVIARAFQRRVEHAKNVHYRTDEVITTCTNGDTLYEGRPSEARKWSSRRQCRCWIIDNSFRKDRDEYRSLSATEPSSRYRSGVNAEEGLRRYTSSEKDAKGPPYGQVDYPMEPIDQSRYFRWTVGDTLRSAGQESLLFSDLLDQKNRFEIEAPVEGDKVRLTVPWFYGPGGKEVYLLDPRKGFLPIRCKSRYDDPPTKEGRRWREETLVVEESRLVDHVWMPVRLHETIAMPHTFMVLDTKALQVEFGTAKPSDIQVPFTQGMRVVDVVEGVEYVADAQGNPAGPVAIVREWRHDPPEGWQRREPTSIPSMASRLSAADREKIREDGQP